MLSTVTLYLAAKPLRVSPSLIVIRYVLAGFTVVTALAIAALSAGVVTADEALLDAA